MVGLAGVGALLAPAALPLVVTTVLVPCPWVAGGELAAEHSPAQHQKGCNCIAVELWLHCT